MMNFIRSLKITKRRTYIKTWTKQLDNFSVNSLQDVKKTTNMMKEKKELFPMLIYMNETLKKLKLNKSENQNKLSGDDLENMKKILEDKNEVIKRIKKESFYKTYMLIVKHRKTTFKKYKNTIIRVIFIIPMFIFCLYIVYLFSNNRSVDTVGFKDENVSDLKNTNIHSKSSHRESEFKLAKNIEDRLSDVKGIDEVREEIEEVVKMLKNPDKYESAGAKLIRGILLIGKPGTGKTLLARALAGESGINFIYVSASQFDKSLVGMGSRMIKNLFELARKEQPCIIFIDEIDTLLHSSRRGKTSSSYESALINTFLSEMDGFQKLEHVFVLGATNSEKDLDKAALRPGRFDKIIYVPIPDKIGRKEIFDLYLKKIKMPLNEISSESLSLMTPGFTGAEIENMVNTAVISAVDIDKKFISKEDFEDARDRVVLGIKKKIKQNNNIRLLLQTAVHEAGHTLVCYKDKFCKNGIHKVTIIPRGDSKGKTSTLLDDVEGTKEEFISMIDMSLAGLIAEEIYFGSEKVSVGCGNDLSRATNLAKSMVKKYAMDNQFGYMVVEDDMIVSHKISSNTRNKLDIAVGNILKQRTSIVKDILKSNISDLKTLSQKLVEYEELNKSDIEKIMSGEEPGENQSRIKKREFLNGAFAL